MTGRRTRYLIQQACMQYVFPVQLAVGVAGNSLNLLVLLSRSMRSRTNVLLASVAFMDIGCLVFMSPSSFFTLRPLKRVHFAYDFYMRHYSHFTALANWSSAASNWFIVAVTIERLVAVTAPLKAKLCWRRGMLTAVCVATYVCTFAATAYLHTGKSQLVTHVYPTANGTNITRRGYTVAWPNVRLHTVGVGIHFFSIIAVPIVIVFASNCVLLVSVWRSHRNRRRNLSAATPKHSVSLLRGDAAASTSQRGSGGGDAQSVANPQRKITIMVFVIISSFLVTNVPSAGVAFWHYTHGFVTMPHLYYSIAYITNSLVLTGKALNFFLYCTSSSNFRQRLVEILAKKTATLRKLFRC